MYKQLYRAAKAKSKLRIKVSTIKESIPNVDVARPDLLTSDRLSSHCYVPPMNPEPLEAENKSPASEQAEKNTAETPSYLFSPSVSVDKELRRLYVHSLKRPVCCVPSITNPKTLAKAEIDTMASTEEVGIKKEIEDEAPVPRFISAHEHLYAELAKERPTLLRSADQTFPVSGTTFTICCNNCDVAIPDAHWHCSICDNGDFDLCAGCVDKGILCGEVDHWLIKRFVQDGKVINSTTETIAPKKLSNAEVSEKDIPGAFTSNNKVEESPESLDETRTCNSCVGGKNWTLVHAKLMLTSSVFTEPNFVTCTVCDDYDLCIPCHVSMKHGHHPSHALKPASNDTVLDIMASNLCAPGRNMRHFAICDGCDKVSTKSSPYNSDPYILTKIGYLWRTSQMH